MIEWAPSTRHAPRKGEGTNPSQRERIPEGENYGFESSEADFGIHMHGDTVASRVAPAICAGNTCKDARARRNRMQPVMPSQ